MDMMYVLVSHHEMSHGEMMAKGNGGNVGDVARRMLDRIEKQLVETCSGPTSKVTYLCDGYNFNILVDGDVIYLCLADSKVGKAFPYEFLESLRDEFDLFYDFGKKADIEDGSRIIASCMDKFDRNKSNNGSHTVFIDELEEVRNVMKGNIEKLVHRKDHLDSLVSRSEQLQSGSTSFRSTTKSIKRYFCYKEMETYAYACLAFIVCRHVHFLLQY